jgi:hypothetical protein
VNIEALHNLGFLAASNAVAGVIWAAMTYTAWRRGVIGLGVWVRPLRREDRPGLFKLGLRIGVGITVLLIVVAIVQAILWATR